MKWNEAINYLLTLSNKYFTHKLALKNKRVQACINIKITAQNKNQ